MIQYKDFIREATSIGMDELSPSEKAELEKFMKSNNLKFLDLFDGIHGKILMVTTSISGHLTKKDIIELNKILSNATKIKTFRWTGIESKVNGIKPIQLSIGF